MSFSLLRRHRERLTTMCAIASEARVTPSSAYYWFQAKDELVQELYQRVQAAHSERTRAALAAGGSLADRLQAVEHMGLFTGMLVWEPAP